MSRVAWLRLLVVVAFFAAVEWLCQSGAISRQTMIPPSEMAVAMVEMLGTRDALADVVETLTKVAFALVGAVIFGFAAGVFIHAVPRLRRALDPFFATYYAVPFFVFYPILIALLGLNQKPVIAIAFLFAVVAMIINTLNGLDRIPKVLTKVSRVHRLGWLAAALKLKLPASAPYLFTGLKLSVAYSFIGVIASEFIMATSGLGYEISYAYNNFQNRKMYALMLFVLVLVTAINMSLHAWEQGVLRRRRGRA
ncbi:MAG: ABC transporter permease [Rhodospirillaceae bacterium]|nr:ABC transporter permease [Rhodospirillaceae bacterium]